MKLHTIHVLVILAAVCLLGALLPPEAHAATYAWETTLDRVIASLSGPVARGVGVAAIVLFGLGLAFSEGGGLRVVIGIIFGLSIAFTAANLVGSLFGFA